MRVFFLLKNVLLNYMHTILFRLRMIFELILFMCLNSLRKFFLKIRITLKNLTSLCFEFEIFHSKLKYFPLIKIKETSLLIY